MALAALVLTGWVTWASPAAAGTTFPPALLLAVDAGAPAPAPEPAWMFVVNPKAQLRTSPAARGRKVVGTSPAGTKLRVVTKQEAWIEVEHPDTLVKGWLPALDLSATPSAPRRLTDAQIRSLLIKQSIDAYPGNCPCPYHADRRGRSCGGRSAWSRAGGDAPYCYEKDVPEAAVEAYRAGISAGK